MNKEEFKKILEQFETKKGELEIYTSERIDVSIKKLRILSAGFLIVSELDWCIEHKFVPFNQITGIIFKEDIKKECNNCKEFVYDYYKIPGDNLWLCEQCFARLNKKMNLPTTTEYSEFEQELMKNENVKTST